MLLIKKRSKYKTIMWVEKSYIKNTEATLRSLQHNKTRFGCVSLYPQPPVDAVEYSSVIVRGAGRRLTPRTGLCVHGLTRENGVVLARLALQMMGQPYEAEGETVLDHVHLRVYTGANVHGFKFDSKRTTNRSVNSRSYQNSFVRLRLEDVTHVGQQGGPTNSASALASTHTVQGFVYAQVECYFQAHVVAPDPGDSPVNPGPFALVQVLRGASRETFAGTPTVVTDEPIDNMMFSDFGIVQISKFRSQMLVLKGKDDIRKLRFVACPGKLYMM